MEASVLQSELVVVVACRAWLARFEGHVSDRGGYGVRYEGELLRSRLYLGAKGWLVLLLPADVPREALPLALAGATLLPWDGGIEPLGRLLGERPPPGPIGAALPWVNPWRALVVVAPERLAARAERLAEALGGERVGPGDARLYEAAVIAVIGVVAPTGVPADRACRVLDEAADDRAWRDDIAGTLALRDRTWVAEGAGRARLLVGACGLTPAAVGAMVGAGVPVPLAVALGLAAVTVGCVLLLRSIGAGGGDIGFWRRVHPADRDAFVRAGLLRVWGFARGAVVARSWGLMLAAAIGPALLIFLGGLGASAGCGLGAMIATSVALGSVSACVWSFVGARFLRRVGLIVLAALAWQVSVVGAVLDFLPGLTLDELRVLLLVPSAPTSPLVWTLAGPGWVGLLLELGPRLVMAVGASARLRRGPPR